MNLELPNKYKHNFKMHARQFEEDFVGSTKHDNGELILRNIQGLHSENGITFEAND